MEISVSGIHLPKTALLFRLSMWWRIFYGVLRIFLGITLLRMVGKPISHLIFALMSHEISGRKGDAVLEMLYKLFEIHQFTASYFIAGYFIFWGTVEIFLSICVLKGIKSAYPVTMGLIVLFICYGAFRFTHTHSLILLSILIIDFGILYLINNEYKKLKVRDSKDVISSTSTLSDPPLHRI
jgi:uncharacterized membrane protein